jgi:hypothetical protein
VRKLETGQSILDAVAGQAKDLQRNVGARDRDRLDQYFTSVRDLEQRMQMSREWERKPKPKVSASMPLDPASPKAYMEKGQADVRHGAPRFRDRFDAICFLLLDSVNSPAIEFGDVKTSDGYHNLSHHGKSTGETGAVEDHRRMAHEIARRTFQRIEGREGRRRSRCSIAR